jgi:hypothetical protein
MASPWVAFEMHQHYRVLLMTCPNIRMLEIQPPLILLLYILTTINLKEEAESKSWSGKKKLSSEKLREAEDKAHSSPSQP